MLQVHENNCYQLTFANGLMVSVSFHDRNYCDNRGNRSAPNHCDNAEIAVFRDNEQLFADGSFRMDDDGNIICPQSNTGWKTSDEIAAATALVATMDKDIKQQELIRLIHECFEQLTPA